MTARQRHGGVVVDSAAQGARWPEFLAVSFALVLWAGAFPAIKVAVSKLDPPQLAELRFLGGSVVLGVWSVRKGPRRARHLPAPDARSVGLLSVVALSGFVTYHVGLNAGEHLISANAAGFLIATVPLFTTVFAVALLGERPVGSLMLGIGLGLGGAAVIAAGQGGLGRAAPGTGLVLMASAGEGLMFVVMKPLLARASPTWCTTAAMALAAVFLSPWLPSAWNALTSSASLEVPVSVGYLAIFPTAIAYVVWNTTLARLPASTTAATLYLMPLLTACASWIVLAETPRVTTVAGGLMSLLGVWLARSLDVRPIANGSFRR